MISMPVGGLVIVAVLVLLSAYAQQTVTIKPSARKVIQELEPTTLSPEPEYLSSANFKLLSTHRKSAGVQGPLSVVIQQPADNETVYTPQIELRGKADPGTVLSINDEIFLISNDCLISATLSLNPGINILELEASDVDGNQDFLYLTVVYEPQD